MKSLKNLSNNDLLNRLRRLVEKEQNTTLEILPHLVEVERRKLYLAKAYSTLSEYCSCELGYGESAAWRRVRAARVILEIPEVYDLMKEGRLTFSAVVQLSPVLNAKNKKVLLPRVEGKSKNEIERILAEFQPPQVIPDQARQRLVKRQVSVECASADALTESAGRGESPPELGEISLRCEGGK
jgi:hypothetical protein